MNFRTFYLNLFPLVPIKMLSQMLFPKQAERESNQNLENPVFSFVNEDTTNLEGYYYSFLNIFLFLNYR